MNRRLSTLLALALAALACNLPLTPEPPPEPTPVPGRGLVAYIGADGNVYTLDPDAPDPTAITTDAQPEFGTADPIVLYRHPAWSPDGQSLAFVRIRSGSEDDGNSLFAAGIGSTSGPQQIFSSQSESPFYLYWAPDSASVTFLTSSLQSNTLAVRQATLDGADSRILDTGQPYYWHWSPDSARILVHIGGSQAFNPDATLGLLDPATRDMTELDLAPGNFQAPAWAPDGKSFLALIAGEDAQDTLARFDTTGALLQTYSETNGLVFFGWSPDGAHIAIHPKTPADPVLGPLLVLDADSGEPVWTSLDRSTLAYFWSPDGKQLAYFHLQSDDGVEALARPVPQHGAGLLSLSVVEVATGTVRLLAQFEPTDAFIEIIPFFDQYHHSMTIWSPDSSHLVYTAAEENGAAVWVVPADGSAPPKWMAEGDLAIWSFK